MSRNHETSFKDPVCDMEVSRTTAIDEFTYLGKTYYFCYEMGYLEYDNEYCSLVVKQEYID